MKLKCDDARSNFDFNVNFRRYTAEPYDPEFDPLGLGPRWEVPWGAPTLLLGLFGVESCFFAAGAIAPAVIYSNVRDPDEIPFNDQAGGSLRTSTRPTLNR